MEVSLIFRAENYEIFTQFREALEIVMRGFCYQREKKTSITIQNMNKVCDCNLHGMRIAERLRREMCV